MDKRPTKRRGPLTWLAARTRRFWIVTAFGLPLLYVLSFGPTCWWFATSAFGVPDGPIGHDAAHLPEAYWPIGWTVDRFQSLRPLTGWYSRLFGDRTAVIVPVMWGRSGKAFVLSLKQSSPTPFGGDDASEAGQSDHRSGQLRE